jgi:hypothetical protein
VSETKLIETAKKGSADEMKLLLHDQPAVNVQDEHGWTPLNWAAGRGDATMVKLLLEKGADCALKGKDNRSAWMIATAAGHRDVANLLMEAEKERAIWKDPWADTPYCKAYRLEDLRAFPHWTEQKIVKQVEAGADETQGSHPAPTTNELTGNAIVYLQKNYVVTALMWQDEHILFDNVTPEWISFCREKLKFQVPADSWQN